MLSFNTPYQNSLLSVYENTEKDVYAALDTHLNTHFHRATTVDFSIHQFH